MKIGFLGVLASATALALALTACGSEPPPAGSTAAASTKTLAACSITMIPKNTDNPYFAAVKYGADQAAKELKGPSVDYVGSAQADLQAQIQRVQSATTRRSCVIDVSAVDASALVPALKAAKAAGVQVVSFDADVSPEARTLFINQVDSTELGVAMFKQMAEEMGYQGDFAILSAQATAANQNAWIAAMLEEAKKPEYAKMKNVKTVYGDDDAKKSYDAATSLLNAFPGLRGIMAPEPAGTQAAVKAKNDLHFNKDLVISGLGWPPGDSEVLKSGKMKAFFLWSPVDLGYLTYYANAALLNGDITGTEGETFTAGRLGEMKVGKDGTVNLGAPQKYTAENVEASLDQFRTE